MGVGANDYSFDISEDELNIDKVLKLNSFLIHELGQRSKIEEIIIPIRAGEISDIWRGIRKCKDFNKRKKYITPLKDIFKIKKLDSKQQEFLIRVIPDWNIDIEYIHINNIPCMFVPKQLKE